MVTEMKEPKTEDDESVSEEEETDEETCEGPPEISNTKTETKEVPKAALRAVAEEVESHQDGDRAEVLPEASTRVVFDEDDGEPIEVDFSDYIDGRTAEERKADALFTVGDRDKRRFRTRLWTEWVHFERVLEKQKYIDRLTGEERERIK